MADAFKEIAEQLLKLGSTMITMQYFPAEGKEPPSQEIVKSATGCRNVKIGYESGVIAEGCKTYPDQIGESYAAFVYAHLKGAGDIAVAPGNPESELSLWRKPSYSWETKRGRDRPKFEKSLKKLGWERVEGMFITKYGLG